MMKKSIYIKYTIVLFLLIWIKGFAQESDHKWNLHLKCNEKIREVRVFAENEQMGLCQCDKKGDLKYYYLNNISNFQEFGTHYTMVRDSTIMIISASSRSGFAVTKFVESDTRIRRYYNSSDQISLPDLDRNTMLKKVRHLRDSTSLLKHPKVQKILAQTPNLIQTDIKNPTDSVRSYLYKDGTVHGIMIDEGDAGSVRIKTKNDRSESGHFREYKDDKLIRSVNGSFTTLFGYNTDGKMVEKNSYKGGELLYSTIMRYNNGNITSRVFQNLKNKRKVTWKFHYNTDGNYETIEKTEGKKKSVYRFEYTYW